MPRFSCLPACRMAAQNQPGGREFDFEEEDADGSDHTKYVWSSAAYAMSVSINRSFKALRLVCVDSRVESRRWWKIFPAIPSRLTMAAWT